MKQFEQEHQEAFGCSPDPYGNPDNGNGYYAEKLTYKQWYDFNNGQRAHYNFLETFTPLAVMHFICAINLPFLAMICGFGCVLGKILYSVGYMSGGPQGRIAGALIVDVALLTVFVGACISLHRWSSEDNKMYMRTFPISQNYIQKVF